MRSIWNRCKQQAAFIHRTALWEHGFVLLVFTKGCLCLSAGERTKGQQAEENACSGDKDV